MTSEPVAGSRQQGLALGVLAGALALDIGGLNLLNAALPEIGDRFDLGSGTLQWTMTSYAVTFAGFLLLSGRMADVIGRRRVFATGVALFTVAALAGAVAPNVQLLIAARAVQGVGAALSGPAALALLTEIFPAGPDRNRAFGVYAAVGAASGSGGLVLGGVLTEYFGWRSVFVLSVVFGGLVLLAVRSALPPSVRHDQGLDLPGAGMVTAGLLLAVFGVTRGGTAGWTDPTAAGPLAAAVLLLVGFVLWERRVTEPLLPLGIFRSAPVRAGSLTAFLQYTATLGLLFFAPLYLQNMLGYSPVQSALAVLPLSAAVFVTANFFTAGLLARHGQRPLLVTGLLLLAVGIGCWAWTSLDGSYWLPALPGVIITGIGVGFVFPSMTAAALTGIPQAEHGVAGAVNVVAQQIGSSIGVAVLVVVATSTATGDDDGGQLAGYHVAYLTAAVLCVLGALVIAFGPRWGGADDPMAADAPATDVAASG